MGGERDASRDDASWACPGQRAATQRLTKLCKLRGLRGLPRPMTSDICKLLLRCSPERTAYPAPQPHLCSPWCLSPTITGVVLLRLYNQGIPAPLRKRAGLRGALWQSFVFRSHAIAVLKGRLPHCKRFTITTSLPTSPLSHDDVVGSTRSPAAAAKKQAWRDVGFGIRRHTSP